MIADVPVVIVVSHVITFVTGVIVGVVLTMLAARTDHPIDFDWRLRIRRADKGKEEDAS